ncbi:MULTISPECIES: hypothetical protein [unclassified Leifsonia]|uniref:hypothetical protein n=1 Tax=unclassified Leifsonia TaxID=2663824 RepID=UPI0008A74205|nr:MULTISPECIES: hypothetical protein [unclassified Leifsonia]SEH78293.1 hypothetical protein SAMN04515694_10429 [Leifsonia sp. CL154]SFL40387.1 hypothetical protein SAMN04515692_10428 [Leifsonia sp. CL147]
MKMRRTRTSIAVLALLLVGVLLTGCSVPTVHRTDVIGLWKHPSDPSQTVDIRSDGTFAIRNVSVGALHGDLPSPSIPYEQNGTWLLDRSTESPRRHYLSLSGVNGDDHTFLYTFAIDGSGATATIYLQLGGRYEGQRFEFKR